MSGCRRSLDPRATASSPHPARFHGCSTPFGALKARITGTSTGGHPSLEVFFIAHPLRGCPVSTNRGNLTQTSRGVAKPDRALCSGRTDCMVVINDLHLISQNWSVFV